MRYDRRTFLKSMAMASCLPVFDVLAGEASNTLRITDVQIWRFEGERPPSEGFAGWIGSNPAKIYDFNDPVPTKAPEGKNGEKRRQSALYLIVKTNQGIEGAYGPIDWEVVPVINSQLKSIIMGQNPLAIELIWDKLYRANRHSRAGHYMMAISAIDNALWDIRGKFFDVPVYQLLGGPTREEVPVYGSCLGFSVEPEEAARRSLLVADQGFQYQKWFFQFGPSQGAKGLDYNIRLIESLRGALGTQTDLMFDAFMSWTFDYALSWCKAAEKFNPRWLEEAFQPAEMNSFARLANKTSVPSASGEHLYNRWEVLNYLENEAITVVQTDPEWCGGISELMKICDIASAYNVMVIPHGHSLHAALHVIAAQSPDVCPMGEYLINKMDYYYMFEKYDMTPRDGKIILNDAPGFGIEFDEAKILAQEQLS